MKAVSMPSVARGRDSGMVKWVREGQPFVIDNPEVAIWEIPRRFEEHLRDVSILNLSMLPLKITIRRNGRSIEITVRDSYG